MSDSSSSTLSHNSSDNTDSTSFNTSNSSDMLLLDNSISLTDSNFDNLTDIIEDQFPKFQSGLYDISVDICMEIPKDDTFNKPDMLRATVYTICGEIFFKHNYWSSISSLVAHHMGRSLNLTNSVWVPVQGKRLVYLGKTKISGHTYGVNEYEKLPLVYDSITYSDNICATNVILKYFVSVFLTPGVVAAESIYAKHGFRTDYDSFNYKKKHMDDIFKGHKAENLKVYDHHLAWSRVYNVLAAYRENICKQNKFFDEYGFSF
uniref:RpoB_5 protein n=1 Tax=Fopius arisanus TaxID=64838 RepID=A0A0C9PK31_9HYME